MDENTKKSILAIQKNELTEYHIYSKLIPCMKNSRNREVLETIAREEKEHYEFWKSITNENLEPSHFRIFWYTMLSRVFGFSFGLKLLEKDESDIVHIYEPLTNQFPKITSIVKQEQQHEQELLDIIEEERIEYAGSMVLGLNDALVELTGALTGFTFAIQDGKIIAITGLIMGVATSLSMAASGYLASKEEKDQNENKKPLKSAAYIGIAYIVTVTFLVFPYFIFKNIYIALACMLLTSIFIIGSYTFYITTAKNLKFWRRFTEMAVISLTVSVISFGVGSLVRIIIGIDI